MRIKEDRSERGFVLGLLILAIGIGIGRLMDSESTEPLVTSAEEVLSGLVSKTHLHKNLRQRAESPTLPDNGLETLTVTFSTESAGVLQRVRDRAMDRGMIIQTPEDTVPALLGYEDEELEATIRIKGDWTDHVSTSKWSLRIKLEDGKLFGMRSFSIQAPFTRGILWEWLVLEAARRERILAPRSTFVNVIINNNFTGVYFLEEHFGKEMLESQGRREGPILLWDEDTRWKFLLQARSVYSKDIKLPIPLSARRSINLGPPIVRAYGEKRLGEIESLSRSFYSGVEQMRGLQNLVLTAHTTEDRMRRLQALTDVEGATIDSLVDTDRLSCAHALASLFQVQHSLYWQNMRFYHDPVTDRLEPILFDNMAHEPSKPDPVMFRKRGLMPPFWTSNTYYNGVFAYLGRMCRPDYLDTLFADLGDDLRRFEAALSEEETISQEHTVAGMMQRLRAEQGYLRNVIYPVDPVNFSAVYELDEDDDERVSGTMEVTAWSNTKSPVVIEGFRLSNDFILPALATMTPDSLGTTPTSEGGVVLPRDGRCITFRFRMDERLGSLENIDLILRDLREEAEGRARKLDLDVDVMFRSIAAEDAQAEKLDFRRRDATWLLEKGRPDALSLVEALERYPFLAYEPEESRLVLQPGTWEVQGDLLVPSGFPLYAKGKMRLQFEEGAVLLTDSPLIFEGTLKSQIILEPQKRVESWGGVVVLKSQGRSVWSHVKVRDTDAVNRAGWVVTGGITFYHSAVTMRDCLIQGTLAEDGTNVFGADVLMERVTFAECVSDSFDGDFVTGTLRDCTFRDGLADGVDFSGSQVDIVNCEFVSMGDKAISAGENSSIRVFGGFANGVSIGIAAKDSSVVEVQSMTIHGARNYALAAFIKKPEFGPASLICTDVVIERSGLGDAIVQTNCTIELNGVTLPTTDLNVKQLYKEKILGQ